MLKYFHFSIFLVNLEKVTQFQTNIIVFRVSFTALKCKKMGQIQPEQHVND